MSIEQRNFSVAADMDRIFGSRAAGPPMEERVAPPREQALDQEAAPAESWPRRAWWGQAAALLLFLTFASAFGLLAYLADQPDLRVPAREAKEPSARPPEIAAASPGQEALPAPRDPVESPPVAGTDRAGFPVEERAAPRLATDPAGSGEAQTTGAGGIMASPPVDRPAASDAPRPLPPPPPPRPGLAASRSAAAPYVDCPPGSTEDRCIYQDVSNAHRRLERAYRRAEFEGVPPSELRAVRRAWNRARDVSLDDPDEAIRQFDGLADYLRRAGR